MPPHAPLAAYLDDARARVLEELRAQVPRDDRHTGGLYGLVLDYPLRPAKALRPAVCMAACRLLGGALEEVLPSAAAIELMHNAFLVHDDVEDGSELRRGRPTLYRDHGVPVAVNVGDGMLALAMRPLVDNTRHLGAGRALAVLEVFVETARVSAEGQALELAWMRDGAWSLSDADYVRMVYKKTAAYSFVAPAVIGAVVAGAPPDERDRLARFAALLGVAFQIRDDLLNLTAALDAYGKEIAGDLWEGKRTLILLHALRRATPADRARAVAALGPREARTEDDVAFLLDLVVRTEALASAGDVAVRHAERASRALSPLLRGRAASPHAAFLEGLVDYVVRRER